MRVNTENYRCLSTEECKGDRADIAMPGADAQMCGWRMAASKQTAEQVAASVVTESAAEQTADQATASAVTGDARECAGEVKPGEAK